MYFFTIMIFTEKRNILFACIAVIFCLGSVSLMAQGDDQITYFDQPVPKKADKELQFIAFFFNQAVTSNYYPTNDFLKGQIIGRLFGQNTTNTSDSLRTGYFEQRFLPFFIYQPKLFNSRVILRASFEIDWTWGDVAYGTGGNFGSAISSDQVNIQTQNLEIEFLPGNRWAINLGLQRLYDTPYNPYRTFFEKMTYTGYRLSYWGTDGVGLTVRKEWDFARLKTGFYQLYENNVQEDDDVILYEATYARYLSPMWNVGASLHYVSDRANGEGGPSILGQGLNSTLSDYNGVYRFRGLGRYQADIGWLGTYFHYNEDLMMDRWILTGFVNYNFGSVREENDAGVYEKTVDVSGIGANLRGAYRHGQTDRDLFSVDLVYSSGDENGHFDGTFNGVITGNTWGSPAAVFISSGSYILFPHGNVVNRFNAAVVDLSNMGYGLRGGTVNLSKAFIPNQLFAKAGMAHAQSGFAPRNGGKTIGTEVNGMVSYALGPFMNLEVHGAYMSLGDFYESDEILSEAITEKPTNPWTAFVVFKWLMF
jgi:hypothetical protein